jgi:hypothetical protein
VTRATALVTLKLANPTAAVATLRARGHIITTETQPDGSGDGTRYTRWTLVKTKQRAVRPAARPSTKRRRT